MRAIPRDSMSAGDHPVSVEALRNALEDALDVGIWLSAFVPSSGEGWDTWANKMRPKLNAALSLASATTKAGGSE